jgi:hypothetical protein
MRFSSRSKLISCSMLLVLGAALGSGCSDEEVNVPSADAAAERDAAGGSGGRDAAADAPADGPADVRSETTSDGPIGPLTLCTRLTNVQDVLSDFTAPYIGALRTDCRVGLLTRAPRAVSLPEFGNQLRQFNFSLWGCDSRPLGGFHLVYQPSSLTPLDVTLLIDIYLDTVRPLLRLSAAEETAMRSELQRLGDAAQTTSSQTYSYSECDAGNGDAGDAGDEGDALTPADAEADAAADATEDAAIGADQ